MLTVKDIEALKAAKVGDSVGLSDGRVLKCIKDPVNEFGRSSGCVTCPLRNGPMCTLSNGQDCEENELSFELVWEMPRC